MKLPVKKEEMKKFNLRIFMIATTVMVLLNLLSWTGSEAYNTPNTSHSLLGIIGSSWRILRFPVFTFFWKAIFNINNVIVYSLSVTLNCIFYAIIIERLNFLLDKRRKSLLLHTK
jgi:hypothetical protein